MKNKLFFVTLCIIFVVSLIVYKKDKSEFTHEEYKVIEEQVTEYFENEDFSCKNERNESDYENWTEWGGRKNTDIYVDPVVCRKISEKEIDGNIYKSEIKYMLISYDFMDYYKELSKNSNFTLSIKNSVNPKEKYLQEETTFWVQQASNDNFMYLFVDKFNEVSYENNQNRHIYIALSNEQGDDANYKYYQDVFKNGIPYEEKMNSINPEELSVYFDLIVEKGYADNLLKESKVSKEEADEIAKRFEKSEIYDKIYNLKY